MEPVIGTQDVQASEQQRPPRIEPPPVLPDHNPQADAACDPHLLAFIADTDHPCPNCGYNLRGLRVSVCPECSQELKLTVGLVDPKLGAWLAGVLGLTCGAGFCLLVTAFVLLELLSRGRSGPPLTEIFAATILPGLILGGCLLALVRSRPKFRKAPRALRIAVAVGCWLLSVASLLWFRMVTR